MLICPDDLEACRRNGCGAGRCERTGEIPLTTCWECGQVISRHVVTTVCVECLRRYTGGAEEGG